MKKHYDGIDCVDLFCGIGGLSYGLKKSGIFISSGVDIDHNSQYPYEKNLSTNFLLKDVSSLEAPEVDSLFQKKYSAKLLAGCAPCQPFSTYSQSSRKLKTDERWALLNKFGNLVKSIQPEMVTMENVPQLMNHSVFENFLSCLEGYSIGFGIVECEKYSIPQTRKRLVLIASKISVVSFNDILIQQTSPAITVKDAIGKLPKIKAGSHDPNDKIHMSPRLSELNLERIKQSIPGGSWRDWDDQLIAKCHKKKSGSTYPSVYGRMSWDKPSPTITTQCFGYGNGRFGHPEQHRAISLREAALLQSFPKKYIFTKPNETPRFNVIGRMIGNAVPVRIGEVVGSALLNSLGI